MFGTAASRRFLRKIPHSAGCPRAATARVRNKNDWLLHRHQERLYPSAPTTVLRFHPTIRKKNSDEDNGSQESMKTLPILQERSPLNLRTTAAQNFQVRFGSSVLVPSAMERIRIDHSSMYFSTTSHRAAAESKDSATTNDDSHHPAENPTYRERAADGAKTLGGMMKLYGPVAVGTYLSVYVATLASLYVGVESGVLDPVKLLGYCSGNSDDVRSTAVVVAELMEHYTITQPFAEIVQEKPNLANLAVAWITTKFTEPIRLAVSVAITPRVARYFGIGPKKDAVIETEKPPTSKDASSEAASEKQSATK